MINTHTFGKITWIDLEHPTTEEVNSLMDTYNLDPLIIQDLLHPTPRQRVTKNGDHIYAVLHFPAFRQTHTSGSGNVQEIDFVLGKNLIITTHYDTIDAVLLFRKEMETKEILGKTEDALFYRLIKNLYAGSLNELLFTESALRNIEERLFNGEEKNIVIELSRLSRNLLSSRQTLLPHKEVLTGLEKMDSTISNSHFSDSEYKHILADYTRIEHLIKRASESVAELRETNDSLLTTKQNEVMKIFTILAFVTFPLSLVASLFGMNTAVLPLVGLPHDFWIVVGIMAILTIGFFAYFRHKKWL